MIWIFPPIQSFYFFQFIIFLFLATRSLSLNSNFSACQPKTCGSGPEIKYPFWIVDQQPYFCGLPSFVLNCENHEPILFMPHGRYLVREIFYQNQSLLLGNENPLQDNCPRPLNNITFYRTPFYADSYIFFFFNCTAQFPGSDPHFPIPCFSNETHHSFAVIAGGKPSADWRNFVGRCESNAAVPFLKGTDEKEVREGYYKEVMEKGFLLQWAANNCSECAASGGRCGFDKSVSQVVCFCRDRSYRVKCNGGGLPVRKDKNDDNTRRNIKIVIGVSAGAGSFILAWFFFYLLQWFRRKRCLQKASSVLLSRNVSSDPSSKNDLENYSSTNYATQLFSYRELQEATNNFDSSNEVGDGGFGTVYYGKLRDGRSVAVKRLYENNYKRVEQFMNEIKILSCLRHRNLVSLYGCNARHSRELLLVYEFIPNGTVADHLHGDLMKNGALTWPVRMNIAIETAEALAYLHAVEPQIIHRDVKTNNILLDINFSVKVADFGLSRLFPTDVTHVSTTPQGTPGYVDPDYHKCYQLTDKSDVYSFGVVLMELVSSKPAVDITRHRHEVNLSTMAINKIHNQALHELVDLSLGFESDSRVRRMMTSVAELAFQCLQEEKEMRPSMEEVLKILKGIDSAVHDVEKKQMGDAGNPVDTIGLLVNNSLHSPDSVINTWDSKSSTPYTSG